MTAGRDASAGVAYEAILYGLIWQLHASFAAAGGIRAILPCHGTIHLM